MVPGKGMGLAARGVPHHKLYHQHIGVSGVHGGWGGPFPQKLDFAPQKWAEKGFKGGQKSLTRRLVSSISQNHGHLGGQFRLMYQFTHR